MENQLKKEKNEENTSFACFIFLSYFHMNIKKSAQTTAKLDERTSDSALIPLSEYTVCMNASVPLSSLSFLGYFYFAEALYANAIYFALNMRLHVVCTWIFSHHKLICICLRFQIEHVRWLCYRSSMLVNRQYFCIAFRLYFLIFYPIQTVCRNHNSVIILNIGFCRKSVAEHSEGTRDNTKPMCAVYRPTRRTNRRRKWGIQVIKANCVRAKLRR